MKAKLTYLAAAVGLSLGAQAQAQSPSTQTLQGSTNQAVNKHLTVPIGQDAQIRIDNSNGASEVSAGVTIKLEDGTLLRISTGAQKAMVAAGWVFRDDGKIQFTGLAGASITRTNMVGVDSNNSAYNTRVQSSSVFGEMGVSTSSGEPSFLPSAATIGGTHHQARAKDIHSSSARSETTEETRTQNQRVTKNPTSTRYDITEVTTKRIQEWLTQYNTRFSGGGASEVHAALGWNTSKNGVLTITVARDKKYMPGASTQKHTSWNGQYNHYFGDSNTLVGLNNSGRLALGFNTLLNKTAAVGIGVFADTRGDKKDQGVYVSANIPWTWGVTPSSVTQNPGRKPVSGAEKLRARIGTLGVWSSEQALAPQLLGQLTTQVQKTLIGESVEQDTRVIASRTVEDPNKNAPAIKLTGDAIVNIPFNGTYTELGATCQADTGITCTVVTSGIVNTGVAGTYQLTYVAIGSNGISSEPLTRTVVVGTAPIDSPTTITLDVTAITDNSANLLCNMIDLNGVSGICTVFDVDSNNSIIYSGPITPTVMALVLKPDRNYQVQLVGTAKNGTTGANEPKNEITNFKTNPDYCTIHPEDPDCQ